MKKIVFIISLIFFLLSCKYSADNNPESAKRTDSLPKQMSNTYKPGFGEFMSSIQAQHSKLWFAGKNKNWKLADFEIHEIIEALDHIKDFQKERKESQMVDMLNPAISMIDTAIQQKDSIKFKEGFTVLTNTCNNCHRSVNFEFIKIKIPETSPFTNQDFIGQ